MKTEEGNELILDFMEYNSEQKAVVRSRLKFHESWDALIPVIQEIALLYEEGLPERGRELVEEIYDMLAKLNIERTRQAVIDFLGWYNKNK